MAPINKDLLLSTDKRTDSHFSPLEHSAIFKHNFRKTAVVTPETGLERCSGTNCRAWLRATRQEAMGNTSSTAGAALLAERPLPGLAASAG